MSKVERRELDRGSKESTSRRASLDVGSQRREIGKCNLKTLEKSGRGGEREREESNSGYNRDKSKNVHTMHTVTIGKEYAEKK